MTSYWRIILFRKKKNQNTFDEKRAYGNMRNCDEAVLFLNEKNIAPDEIIAADENANF